MPNPADAIRRPAVSGMFYPGAADSLTQALDDAFSAAQRQQVQRDAPYRPDQLRAVIVPHAGYAYSAACAAAAYDSLRALRGTLKRVVLIGPSHRHAFRGVALSGYRQWETPLGPLPIDQKANIVLAALPNVQVDDRAHDQDHALEVQLPFILRQLGTVLLVPLAVGQADVETIMDVLRPFIEAQDTLIVVSTDLSHFLDQSAAQSLDQATMAGVDALDLAPLNDPNSACGRFPLAAMLRLGAGLGWRLQRRAQCTSADVTGDQSRVVGYASWLCWQPTGTEAEDEAEAILQTHGPALYELAQAAITYGLRTKGPLPVQQALATGGLLADPDPVLRQPGASFVTLTLDGALRGCIGSLQAGRRLDLDVWTNAHKAAFSDHRFPPLSRDEWARTSLTLSLLTPPAPFTADNRATLLETLRPGIDGLIVQEGDKRALFLPAVWESLPSADAFVDHLWQKAGLPAAHWSPSLRFWRFASRSRTFGPQR